MAERGTKSAAGRKASKPKMKTREVRIRPAKNGFTVAHDQEPADPGKGNVGMYNPPEETVHETPESMMQHVGSIFGAKPGAEPDGDEGDGGEAA